LVRIVCAGFGAVACALIVAVAASPALAAPLQENRAKARALAAEVSALDARIDQAVLRYAKATEALDDVRVAIRRNRRRQAVTRYELDMARRVLTERAVSLYKFPAVSSLDAVFGADDFNELVDQLVMFKEVQRGDREAVDAVAATRDELTSRAATLAADLRSAEQLVRQREAEYATIRGRLGQRRALLAGVQAEIRRLVAEKRTTVTESQPAVKPPHDPEGGSGQWWPLIQRAAAANGVSARGMYRLMMIESGGSATVVSAGTFYGLFQYCIGTWRGSWNPYRACSITDGAAQIRATALALRLGRGPFWWRNTYPWAFG
jgi:hypothetical protein